MLVFVCVLFFFFFVADRSALLLPPPPGGWCVGVGGGGGGGGGYIVGLVDGVWALWWFATCSEYQPVRLFDTQNHVVWKGREDI